LPAAGSRPLQGALVPGRSRAASLSPWPDQHAATLLRENQNAELGPDFFKPAVCPPPPWLQARQVPCMVRIEGDKVAQLTFGVTVATADATTTDALKTELCQLLSQL
jgi:hypothetical protein